MIRNRRAGYVLLDRDGTIIVEKNYLADPADVELIDGAAEGLRLLYDNGFGLIVVSNQSGIGRGLLTGPALARIHLRLEQLLEARGVRLEAIYCCPHTPDDRCTCRKPAPELALDAARDFGFDPGQVWVIGDKPCDIELANCVGARSVLVRTGYGAKHEASGLRAGHTADNLLEAAKHIIMESRFIPIELVDDAAARLRSHMRASIATKEAMLAECEPALLEAARLITRALGTGRKLLFCGNGGSAADSQHIAAEFVSVLTQHFLRPGLAAISLATDSSILTASANDFGFEGIFARQVQALGAPGDVVIGISTSGNSANVVQALAYARDHGMIAIGFSGASGGAMAEFCDVCLRVPSTITQFIQEAHIMAGHIVCDLAEQSLHAAGLIDVESTLAPATVRP
ncbi:MAG: HAD-IIIA family hydrolase [Terriglobia bacterium]